MSIYPHLPAKKNSFTPLILEPPTLEMWKQKARDIIDLIAETDPKKAEYLSKRVYAFKGLTDQKEELRSLGLSVPVYFATSGLPGGMFAEEAKPSDTNLDVPEIPPIVTPTSSSSAEGPKRERHLPPPPPSFDPHKSPEEACPLIAQKLANPSMPLYLDDSIELLTTCIAYGSLRAEQIEGQEAVIVIGNTDSGKSCFVNYLAGCTMDLKSPDELGITNLEKLVVVRPPSEGGALNALMKIGHTKQSTTFIPDIKQTPDNYIYCDCPGFLDNRGEEINIANAVNIRNTLMRASRVKILVLINYHTLVSEKGRGLNDMLRICSNLFGSMENLENYAPSLLLGITKVPLDMELNTLKNHLLNDTPPIMQVLTERLFIYDPLDRPFPQGGWDRNKCLSEIDALPAIDNPSSIFKTVLTESDEKKLVVISEQMGEDIKQALECKDYPLAASRLHHLQSLSIIEHLTVERLLNQNFYKIGRHFQKTQDDFKDHCHFDNFLSAQAILQELTGAIQTFGPQLKEIIEIDKLQEFYNQVKKRYEDRKAYEEKQEQALKEAHGEIEKLLELLQEQKKDTLEQMQRLESLHEEKQQALSFQVSSIQEAYQQMQERLELEKKTRLEEKEKELDLARSLGQKVTEEMMNKEKKKLEEEYRCKLEKSELEKQALLKEQQAIQEQHQRILAAEQNKLQEKLQAIEVEKIEKEKTLKAVSLPALAFGPDDWSRYFGEVDEVPPLPNNIEEILNSPCPFFFIKENKKVKDTHLLVLMPRKVNGTPLTLNILSQMIQNPQGGGHSTRYKNKEYYKSLQDRNGDEQIEKPYWLLITKDIIPNSRVSELHTFELQLKHYEKEFEKFGYYVPKALEVATALLMHHVRTGNRLCPDIPTTYTRCKEKFDKFRVCIGNFADAPNGGLEIAGHDRDGKHLGASLGLLVSVRFDNWGTLTLFCFLKINKLKDHLFDEKI